MSGDGEENVRAGLRPGTVLKGRWRIDGVLGVGGMAAVYAATHRNGNRVALKVLHRELSIDAAIRKRFLREGYASNTIAHPGVVRVHDDDVTDDGAVFFTMDLLVGESLESRAKRVGYSFATTEILGTMYAVLDVLAAAHEKGIVHRDIKPANIFVSADGSVQLLDFGVAQIRNAPELVSMATNAGAMLGTPAFMAPEQALGKTDLVDARTDVWAIGATMYYLLTGQAVHQGSTLNEQLVFAATKPAAYVADVSPQVPRPVADLVARALSFDRENRFQTARDMQAAIARLPAEMASMTTHPVVGSPSPPSSPSIVAIASARTLHAAGESASSSSSLPAIASPPLRRRAPLFVVAAALVAVVVTIAVVSVKGAHSVAGHGGVPAATVLVSSAESTLPPPEPVVPLIALPPPTTTAASSVPVSAGSPPRPLGTKPPPAPSGSHVVPPSPHPPPSSSSWLDQR